VTIGSRIGFPIARNEKNERYASLALLDLVAFCLPFLSGGARR
jgi:hypothetical protein